MIGFVGFVASLQRGHLKSQFGLFCWVHMSLLVIVVSMYFSYINGSYISINFHLLSHFIMNNILEGLIWFWVPASLVICNDIFAYIWGVLVPCSPDSITDAPQKVSQWVEHHSSNSRQRKPSKVLLGRSSQRSSSAISGVYSSCVLTT